MTDNPLNAPEGVQAPDIVPGETIATEMPSSPETETPPAPEPDAVEEEAPAAEATPAPEPDGKTKPTEKQPLSWQEKRRIEETNKRRAAEARAVELEAEVERLRKAAATPQPATADGTPAPQPAPTATLSPEEAKRQARLEIEAEQKAREFTEATGRVLNAGLASFPDFDQARVEMVNNFGDQLNARPDFFEAITSLGNGHEVFYGLAKNPEETERLLSLSPVKMALEIAKRGGKTPKPEPAPEPKQISKAPAPIKPTGGAPQASDRLDDPNIPMDQFAKTFLKQVASRGR